MIQGEAANPQNVDQLRYWLELGSYVSGIILTIFGAIALWQLKLAKDSLVTAKNSLKLAADELEHAKSDLRLRVKREAIVLAAQQCEKFAEHILPRYAASHQKIIENGNDLYKWTVVNKLFDETTVQEIKQAKEWSDKISAQEETRAAVVRILNDHEAFAIYFAKGAADETVAFPSVGVVFCDTVEICAPFLIAIRKNEANVASGPFQNLIALYSTWSARIKQQSLEESKRIHDSEAAKMRAQAAEITVPKITPVGFEED